MMRRPTWIMWAGILGFCLLAGCVPADLPDRVIFKGNRESLNRCYYVAVRDGNIWIKPNSESTGTHAKWRMLTNLPQGLKGQVTEIAVDDEHIIALNQERQIYTMWSALGDVKDFRWQKAWGFPFWYGPGMKLRSDLLRWDFSVVSIPEDGHWTDPAGNLYAVGLAKCSHIIMLNPGGRTITFNDPWLPTDYSYEIGTPYRGRFISVGLSSSGSTHFIINAYGDMFTRLYDFDISGMDNIFMPYSYEDQRGKRNAPIQLPAEPWRMQPKIETPGKAVITDRISITKLGKNCVQRILRVEGRDAQGHTGYYEKDMRASTGAAWTFQRTDLPLLGQVLENKPYDSSRETLGPGEDVPYAMPPDQTGLSLQIPDFNCYNSPARMQIRLMDGNTLDLVLHYTDTIRIQSRARGIDDNPRAFAGAIEAPQTLIDSLATAPQGTRDFCTSYLAIDNGRRFTEITLTATTTELRIKGETFDWTLKR